jgi:hypothetical protein
MRCRFIVGGLVAAFSLAFGTLAVADSHNEQQTGQSATAKLAVAVSSVTMTVGQTTTVNVSGTSGTVSLSNSNSSVASATYSNGVVTVKGLKTGATTISVKDRNSTRTISVSVIADLTVSLSNVALTVGNSATVLVSGASGTVSLTNSAPTVASATYSNGVVTIKGLSAGSDTIGVKDSRTTKNISVTVVNSGGGGGTPPPAAGTYSLMAWNDLGMHCVDGKDFSIFSILPPYNNLHAQLVNKSTGKQVTTGVTLTYESLADTTVPTTDPAYNSINTSSATKTNFWQYVQSLFGARPADNFGLNLNSTTISNRTPGTTPMQMQLAPSGDMFIAEGLPITPYDDKGVKNFYPMIKVTAKDSTGKVLATARTVLPVSDEMTCKACHSSTTATNNPAQIAAKPASPGWVFNADPEKDWKLNILRLHDQKKFADPVNKPLYVSSLAALSYNSAGLETTANNGKPVLCAACHSSNALGTAGQFGVRALTHALHTKHATVNDPVSQQPLGSSTNIDSCYMCHPGSQTECNRGAMSLPKDANGNQTIACQNCHGSMAQVGNVARTGWLDVPNCQACHNNGKRDLVGVGANGLPKATTDTRFATNANTPLAGKSLYRFSKGHGGLQCEACHGATHAEYPSSHSQDNALSLDLQGHAGPIVECTACHTTVPNTTTGGPHGMHTAGQAWVSGHESAAKANRTACTACHGADYRGSPLSKVWVAKTFRVEGSNKTFPANHQIGCYDCHNGPNP